MRGAQVAVGGPGKPDARTDVRFECDPNRFVDKKAKFREEPFQGPGVPPDWKHQCPLRVHALP